MALKIDTSKGVLLDRASNQALGIGEYAIEFIAGRIGEPDAAVYARVNQLFTDSVICGLSAIALGTNAPRVLREEAADYADANGAAVFGSTVKVHAEKAIVANSSAVREWDSNGTNFGFNKKLNHTAGEFGHNDFYPVVIAACQMKGLDGTTALRAMIAQDQIRAAVGGFSLKTYKIDHVVHGAIASAAVYGAIMGASAEQIEAAIGMTVAHYIPFRAIRAGKQLSDSKGSSAAISTEVAVLSMMRAMRGFMGPRDIFRNPQAIFRFFEPVDGDEAPFDLVLTHTGDDFALMGMHFKLGLYEHQSAGALQGLIDLIRKSPELLLEASGERIASILVKAYEPAFGIIGDPAKRNPKTRQSADHSMVYIVATKLRKALEIAARGESLPESNECWWMALMLSPYDYDRAAIANPVTRALMAKISFEHGGAEYDAKYPDGIPTSMVITDVDGKAHDSGFVMYPSGHARNTTTDLAMVLKYKFNLLGSLAVEDTDALTARFALSGKSAAEVSRLYDFEIGSCEYVE